MTEIILKMKTNLFLMVSCAFLLSCQNQAQNKKETANTTTEKVMKQSIHTFKVQDIEGKEFDFATLKGKKIMVIGGTEN